MKTMIGLVVMIALVAGVVVGCDSKPSEWDYKDVTIGPMTVSIPDDWERQEEVNDFISNVMGSEEADYYPYVWFDVYGSSGGGFILAITVMEMNEVQEDLGMTWEGWEATMEMNDTTKEGLLDLFEAEVIEECTQKLTFQHTIHGNEALEGQFECMAEEAPPLMNVLLVFAENDLGIIMFGGEDFVAAEFEEVWETIRDSVEFQD